MKQVLNSKQLSQLGPYSHIVRAGNTYYFSGQLGINLQTGQMGETIEEQTTFALENIQLLLQEAGLTKNAIVKTLVLLKDIQDFPAMNQIYGNFFDHEPPARSAFQVAALPNNGLVEIEVIAVNE